MRRTLAVAVGVGCLLAGVTVVGVADVHHVTVTYAADRVSADTLDADDAVLRTDGAPAAVRETVAAAVEERATDAGWEVRFGSADATLWTDGPAAGGAVADARFVRYEGTTYRLVTDRDATDRSGLTDGFGVLVGLVGLAALWIGVRPLEADPRE